MSFDTSFDRDWLRKADNRLDSPLALAQDIQKVSGGLRLSKIYFQEHLASSDGVGSIVHSTDLGGQTFIQ